MDERTLTVLDTYESLVYWTSSKRGSFTYSLSFLAPILNKSPEHSEDTSTAALPFQDSLIQWCNKGRWVVTVKAETQEGAVLQPIYTGTLSAETLWLLDELHSTPELQGKVQHF